MFGRQNVKQSVFPFAQDNLPNRFPFQLEMKQRYLVGKMNISDEKGDGGHDEVTMETLGEDTI